MQTEIEAIEADEMTNPQYDDAAEMSAWIEERVHDLHVEAMAILTREQVYLRVLTGQARQSEFMAVFEERHGQTWESYDQGEKERLTAHIAELRKHGRQVSPDLLEQLAERESA